MLEIHLKIALSEPNICGNEWSYIENCLKTGWVSSAGSYVNQFEDAIKNFVGSRYGIATVNGTAALHVSMVAAGISSQDAVLLPTLTFVATANTIKYCGAEPIFMDCYRDNLCLDIEKLKNFLNQETIQKKDGFTYHKKTAKRISAIMPVHVYGQCVDMEALVSLCEYYRIKIIEDAAESLGSFYKNKHTGTFGLAGCFSFNGNKIITSGSGGMVVTNDEQFAARVRHLTTQAKTKPTMCEHDAIGFNYRMSNMHAALGLGQMENLNKFLEIKRKNALFYKKHLSDLDIPLLWEKPNTKSNFWFYIIRVPKKHKNKLINCLLSNHIHVQSVWKPLHQLPMYQTSYAYHIESAHEVYETSLCLPCSTSLQYEDIDHVCKIIKKYFKK